VGPRTLALTLPAIIGLFLGGILASLVVFGLARLLGVSLYLSYLLSGGASGAWWIVGYQRRVRRRDWQSLQARFSPISGWSLLASIAGGAALNVLPESAAAILRRAGVGVAMLPPETLAPVDVAQLVIAVPFIVLLIPVAEELMFRGLLLDWFRQKMPARPAVLLGGAFFALLHDNHLGAGLGGWLLLGGRFLFGVGTSMLAMRDNSLRGPLIMHATNNLITCVTSVIEL
jgi:uncharacterized protein